MLSLIPLEPVDYLAIGHMTEDITPAGPRLGGTAAFAALTARAFGLRTGIITSVGESTSLHELQGIPVLRVPTEHSTTFENIRTPAGRKQIVRRQASKITLASLPDAWRKASIVHLGPVAQELEPESAAAFPSSMLGITPQGWMRTWDEDGNVTTCDWASAAAVLPRKATDRVLADHNPPPSGASSFGNQTALSVRYSRPYAEAHAANLS